MLDPDKTAANVAIVQNCYALFARGDVPAMLSQMPPDVVWESVGRREDFPLLGVWNGRDGAAAFIAGLGDLHEFTEFTPQEFYPSGDKVFVCGHYEMNLKTTGRHAAMDWVHIFTLRDGLVSGFREHTDTAQLAAAWRK